jgi:hypothetical protein
MIVCFERALLLDGEWAAGVARFTKALLDLYARTLPELFSDRVLKTAYGAVLDELAQVFSEPSRFMSLHLSGTPGTGYTDELVVDEIRFCLHATSAAYDAVRLIHGSHFEFAGCVDVKHSNHPESH